MDSSKRYTHENPYLKGNGNPWNLRWRPKHCVDYPLCWRHPFSEVSLQGKHNRTSSRDLKPSDSDDSFSDSSALQQLGAETNPWWNTAKTEGPELGWQGVCTEEWRAQRSKWRTLRRKPCSVVQTLNNLHPLKIPEPRCSASSKSTSYHTHTYTHTHPFFSLCRPLYKIDVAFLRKLDKEATAAALKGRVLSKLFSNQADFCSSADAPFHPVTSVCSGSAFNS